MFAYGRLLIDRRRPGHIALKLDSNHVFRYVFFFFFFEYLLKQGHWAARFGFRLFLAELP
jgi:hypothetical protein